MKQIAKAAAMLVFLAFVSCEEEDLPEPEKIIFLSRVQPATASGIQGVLRKARILRCTELNYSIPDLPALYQVDLGRATPIPDNPN